MNNGNEQPSDLFAILQELDKNSRFRQRRIDAEDEAVKKRVADEQEQEKLRVYLCEIRAHYRSSEPTYHSSEPTFPKDRILALWKAGVTAFEASEKLRHPPNADGH